MIIKLPYRGRQTGKTTQLVSDAVQTAMNNPNIKIGFVAPDKANLKCVQLLIKQQLQQNAFEYKEHYGQFILYNGATITMLYLSIFKGFNLNIIYYDEQNLESTDPKYRQEVYNWINNVFYPLLVIMHGKLIHFNFKPLNSSIIRERLGIK